ncbi:MAG: DNA internalization-related competence protein ComEC/Rec2 [Lachnospiraceae bacterium]|nr:DNA internalization-related competence protein ComEC/Rec2 [Lachnospiraceae bacterium]
MNNRPLFWAVMCFALGEVLYIIAGKGGEIGTALAVLICVAIIFFKATNLGWRRFLYLLLFVIGFGWIWWCDNTSVEKALFGSVQYTKHMDEYDGYSVSYISSELDKETGEEDMAYTHRSRYVSGVGVVDDLTSGGSGYNVTLKMIDSCSSGYDVTTKLAEGGVDGVTIHKSYKVIVYGVKQQLSIGDEIRFEGEINNFAPSGNPGEFNRGNYYKARGIVAFATGSNAQVELLGSDRMWYSLKRTLYNFRESLSNSLSLICNDDKSVALYQGILLGDKNQISDTDMLMFRLSGIAHIFAISGLHIGILGGLMYKLLRKLGIKFLPAAIVAMIITFLYGIMTGFSFSTIRAIVMLGLSLGGEVLGRRYDMLTGMGLALGVLLVISPFRLMDGGLILSFGAVAGVVVSKYIVKLLENYDSFRKLQKKKTRWIYKIVSGFIFSVGISIVTAPLIAFMYFQIPLYSVIINMLVVPLMSVTVFCGFFGVLVGLISPIFGHIIIVPGVLSLRCYHLICRFFQMLPFDLINTGKPKLIQIIIYYLVLAIVLICVNPNHVSWIRKTIHNKTKKWIPYMRLRLMGIWLGLACGVVGGLVILGISICDAKERIIFLDVGQGDGILLQSAYGTNLVIDVGSTSNNSLGEYVAYPALLSERMDYVDYWFITHFDGDHTSGLEYILTSQLDIGITIDNIVVSEKALLSEEATQLLEQAEYKGINIIYMKQGDFITDGSFVLKAIHPDSSFESEDRNEQSLVLEYKSESFDVLFTGDIGEAAIKSLLDKGCVDRDYDILKVPHHGSKYSYSMIFLERINPEVSIISCAKRNSYGHPHREMVEGLAGVGSQLYRTDYMGAVVIEAK